MTRFLVLGAGVAGLCAAAELAARGAPVRIVDPAGGPGPQGCSWWAGGMLAPDCEAESADPLIARLGREAADWWAARGAQVTRAGSLVVALPGDGAALDAFAARSSGWRMLDAEALAALEPDLGGRFSRALFFPDEAHLDPRAALAALRDGLAARGVEVARALDPAAPRPAATLDCRGLGARDLLPDLRGVRGEMMILRGAELRLGRPVRVLHPRHPIYVTPRAGGALMLGATQIESDWRGPARARSAHELLSVALALHPALAEAEILELGADARPAFPDNIPRLRRQGDRIHLNGLFRHGFLMAPVLARMAAEHLLDGRMPELMDHAAEN
ncbi:FAD-dependent oxidoreductase [Oceanicella actignis]|uniref:D-amino-acid oxidase n=1 Tax=Oceanicella actignis TaxID=1189325 RepID=A0A1M7RT79_9RHOB|nr:FAD-dependent oxidoreductase [Oceanicella actignis]SET05365.1 glycine oxidase [Oceanicella actignis]SHN49298.1 glycine oxidase [Oceanicella actignis]